MSQSSYSKNIYKTYTEGTYPKTDELATNSQKTLERIGATNPLVMVQANILQPLSTSVNTNYILYKNLWNTSMRATIKEELFQKLAISTLRQLDIDIQHVYNETTDEYQTIFVKTRSTLYYGLPNHTFLVNLKSLTMTLGVYPSLSALKIPFDAFITNFSAIIDASTNSKTDLDQQSTVMETARLDWCNAAYGVTGQLMTIFMKTPASVDDFFDLSIFDTRQSHIDPDAGADVVAIPVNGRVVWDKVFDPSKSYQIHNCGFGVVDLGSTPASTTDPIPNPSKLAEDESKIFAGGDLGDMAYRYLIFKSEDTVLPGEIKIKEIPA